MREHFSLTEEEGKYVGDDQAKIEMVNCPLENELCLHQLTTINQYYTESNNSHLSKDYHKSIEALKLAFNCTYEINNSSCIKCAELFRSTIISSLENMHSELQSMTTGWVKYKRHQQSLELASLVLKEFKKKK